jgi:hypothetical protein
MAPQTGRLGHHAIGFNILVDRGRFVDIDAHGDCRRPLDADDFHVPEQDGAVFRPRQADLARLSLRCRKAAV